MEQDKQCSDIAFCKIQQHLKMAGNPAQFVFHQFITKQIEMNSRSILSKLICRRLLIGSSVDDDRTFAIVDNIITDTTKEGTLECTQTTCPNHD